MLEAFRQRLVALRKLVVDEVQRSCEAIIDSFLRANSIALDHKMTFIEKAALRGQCRRLTCFIRLIDLLLCNQLRDIYFHAITTLQDAVTFDTSAFFTPRREEHEGEAHNPLVELLEQLSARGPQSPRGPHSPKASSSIVAVVKKSSLFSVRAQVKTVINHFEALTATEGTPTPPAERIVAEPELQLFNDAIENIIETALELVSGFEAILSAPELESYIQKNEEDTVAAGLATEKPDAHSSSDKDLSALKFAATTHAPAVDSSLQISIRSHVTFAKSRTAIFQQVSQAYGGIDHFLVNLAPYRQVYQQNVKDYPNIAALFPTGELQTFTETIAFYNKQIDYFNDMPALTEVGMYLVDSQDMKASMSPSPAECLKAIGAYLPQLTQKHMQQLLDILDTINPVLAGEPTTVEAYVHKRTTKDKAVAELDTYKERQHYVRELVQLMDTNKWPVTDDLKALLRMLREHIDHLEVNIESAISTEEAEVLKFRVQVTHDCPKVYEKLNEVDSMLQAEFISNPEAEEETVIKYLLEQESQYTKLKQHSERLQEYQNVLKVYIPLIIYSTMALFVYNIIYTFS